MELKTLTLNGKTYDSFASNVLIVTVEGDVASHSASEINASAEAGKTVFFSVDGSPLPLSAYSADSASFVELMNNTTTGSFGEMRIYVDNEKKVTYDLKTFKVYSQDQTDENIASAVEDALTQAKANGDFKGDKGEQGIQGIQGEKGETGAQGEKGEKGDKGDTGPAYTLTSSDKSEMVNSVLAALPTWTGGSY